MLSFIFVIVCGLCELKRIWLSISILPLEIQLLRGEGVGGWDPINRFNPATYLVVFYVFNDLRSEVTVGFVDIGEIVDHHYWNFICILIDI